MLCELALTQENSWRQQYTKRQGFAHRCTGHEAARAGLEPGAAQRIAGLREQLVAVRALPDAQLGCRGSRYARRSLSLLLRRAAAELQLVFADTGQGRLRLRRGLLRARR